MSLCCPGWYDAWKQKQCMLIDKAELVDMYGKPLHPELAKYKGKFPPTHPWAWLGEI